MSFWESFDNKEQTIENIVAFFDNRFSQRSFDGYVKNIEEIILFEKTAFLVRGELHYEDGKLIKIKLESVWNFTGRMPEDDLRYIEKSLN